MIDAVWQIESARLIAGLARIVRDVGLAADLAQDALVAALEPFLGGLFEPKLNPCGLHLVLRPREADIALVVESLRDKGIECDTIGGLTRASLNLYSDLSHWK